MTTEPAVLGLDLGTSQLKALLCAPGGEVLGRGIASYQVRAPRVGWAETDPEEWWRAAAGAVRAAVAEAGGADIAGLAVVGQMHGLVLQDAAGEVLRPAILWLDRRSAAEAGEYLRLPDELRSALGNPPSVGMAGPTLRWLARHEPDAYRRARWMFQPKDWLRWRLTGEAAAEPTDASGTLLYDLARGGWSVPVAEALGLRTDLLPPLRQPAELAGRLRPAAAEHLGLPAGLPVAAGAADTAASLAAAALPGGDWALLTVGTGGQWIAPAAAGPGSAAAGSGARLADPRGQTNLFCSADGGTYRLAAAQNVGIALDWVTGILRADWQELYATAAAPWQASTPLFLPLLAGERWDDAAAAPGGAWEGLSLAHQREDLMRAAVEGVAFLLRAKLEDLHAAGCHPAKAVFAGGGSQHPDWHRLLGTVLRLPLFPASTPWLSARGATLIAGVATGMYRDWQDAARSVPPPRPAPEVGPGKPADEHYQRFRRLRNRAAGTATPT